MEKLYGYIPQFMIDNSVVWGLLLYWLPLVICAVYFSKRFVDYYRADLNAREGTDTNSYYKPQLTVGAILSALIIIGMPVVNLVYGALNAAPHMFSGFFKWCGRVFDFPLVPDSANHKVQRLQKTEIARAREREARASHTPPKWGEPRSK